MSERGKADDDKVLGPKFCRSLIINYCIYLGHFNVSLEIGPTTAGKSTHRKEKSLLCADLVISIFMTFVFLVPLSPVFCGGCFGVGAFH